jgi:hypothetical protein
MKRGVISGGGYRNREEGEINGRMEMALTSGARLAVRQRRGKGSWAGSGAIWASWFPGAAQVGCWLFLFNFFSFCFLFLLFLISDFWFLK